MKKLLGYCLLLSLTACASAPTPVHRYALVQDLPTTTQSTQAVNGDDNALSILPVEMASFIAGNGIVIKTSATQYTTARYHLWVGNISQQMTQKITTKLAKIRSTQTVLVSSEFANLTEQPNQQVQVKVSDFYGDHQGNAVLAGQWVLLDSQGKRMSSVPFVIKEPLADDGYDALVVAMSATVDQLADQINQKIP